MPYVQGPIGRHLANTGAGRGPSGRTPRCGRTRQGAGAGGWPRQGHGWWRGARGEERWARGSSGRMGACALGRECGATGEEAAGRGGHGAGAVHGGVAAGPRPRGRLRGKGRAELREHAGERVPSRMTPARGQRGRWGWRSQGVAGDWAAGREEEDGDAGDVGEAVRRGGLWGRRRARGGRSGRIGGARQRRGRSDDGVVGRGSPATMGRRRAPASGSGATGPGRRFPRSRSGGKGESEWGKWGGDCGGRG